MVDAVEVGGRPGNETQNTPVCLRFLVSIFEVEVLSQLLTLNPTLKSYVYFYLGNALHFLKNKGQARAGHLPSFFFLVLRLRMTSFLYPYSGYKKLAILKKS